MILFLKTHLYRLTTGYPFLLAARDTESENSWYNSYRDRMEKIHHETYERTHEEW